MKITNKHNLPEPYVKAAQPFDLEKRPDLLRVTTLTRPPMIAALERENWNKIVADVTDRLFILDGESRHYVLQGSSGDALSEVILEIEILGATVRGRLDLLEKNGTLSDYKKTSVFTVKNMKKEMRPEYEAQLNMYAYMATLMRKNASDVKQYWPEVHRLQIVAESRDWRQSEAKRDRNYPDKIEVIRVPKWSEKKVREYMEERVSLHMAARSGEYATCTDEERWKRDDKWAVMSKGRKNAVKLHDNEQDAKDHVDKIRTSESHYVEHRPGAYVRCDDYCHVRPFCPIYKVKEKLIDSKEYDSGAEIPF